MKNSIINLKAYRYILQILEGKSEFNNVKLSMEKEGYVFLRNDGHSRKFR